LQFATNEQLAIELREATRASLKAEDSVMTRTVLILLVLCILTPANFAQQLPPPQYPADAKPKTPPQGPAIIPPQNNNAINAAPPGVAGGQPNHNPAAQPANKNPGKPPEFWVARRAELNARKQAQVDRMKQFKAERAAEQEKLYQDWHERYLADTPVRVEYYRAQAAAFAYRSPYYYSPAPIILPVVYAPVVYGPIYQPPIYGCFSCGW
jgi:hypothetical protein